MFTATAMSPKDRNGFRCLVMPGPMEAAVVDVMVSGINSNHVTSVLASSSTFAVLDIAKIASAPSLTQPIKSAGPMRSWS